jgi:hypothetical protein
MAAVRVAVDVLGMSVAVLVAGRGVSVAVGGAVSVGTAGDVAVAVLVVV